MKPLYQAYTRDKMVQIILNFVSHHSHAKVSLCFFRYNKEGFLLYESSMSLILRSLIQLTAFVYLIGGSMVSHAHIGQPQSLILDENFIQPSAFDEWLSIESEHFILHFQSKHQNLAKHTAQVAEQVHQALTVWLDWEPKQKTHVVINDSVDFANGGATVLPFNQFYLYLSPPTSGDLLDNQTWIRQVLIHEYTHILHLDQAAGAPNSLRNLFGRQLGLITPLTFPQLFAPKWLSEGLAIHAESKQGYGRQNSPLYAAKMRQEVIHGLTSYSEQSYEGYYASRWPFGEVYLYGAYFYEFIAEVYSEDTIIRYLKAYNKNLLPWQMELRNRKTFGKTSDQLWQQFTAYLIQKFEPEIERLKAKGIVNGSTVVDTPYYNSLITAGPNDSVFYYHKNMHSESEIRQVSRDGLDQLIIALDNVVDLDYHPEKGLLFSHLMVCDNVNLYADLFVLSPKQTKPKRLTKCARVSNAKWHPSGKAIYGVRTLKGQGELVHVKIDNGEVNVISKRPVESTIGQFDIAKNGQQLIASVQQPKQGWGLMRFNLETQAWHPFLSPETPTTKLTQPLFSQDGTQIFYIKHHASQVELHSTPFTPTEDPALESTWTRSLGFVQSFTLENNHPNWLGVYSGQGERLHRFESTRPIETHVLKSTSEFSSPQTLESKLPPHVVGSEASALAPTPYSAWPSMRPRGWFPLYGSDVNGDKAIGVVLTGHDILGFHNWLAAPIVYDNDTGKKLGGVYRYTLYRKLTLAMDKQTTSYGETTNSLVQLKHSVNQTDWALDFNLGHLNRETQTRFGAIVQNHHNKILGGFVQFNNGQVYLNGAGYSNGGLATIGSETYLSGSHSGQTIVADLNYFFDLHGTTLKTSLLAATADKTAESFELGGANQTYFDLLPETRLGNRAYPLRGYPNNASSLNSHSFQRIQAEYRFPIAKIYNGWQSVPVGIGRIDGNVFAETALLNNHQYSSIGAEIDLELLIGFDTLNLPLLIGVAQGLDPELGQTQLYLTAQLAL